jgi:hypothetical protein
MSERVFVRSARPDDAPACGAIYRPFVEQTATTFEIEVPTSAEMARRIEAARAGHEWLVLVEDDGTVVGYVYAHAFSPRAAYQWIDGDKHLYRVELSPSWRWSQVVCGTFSATPRPRVSTRVRRYHST